MCDGAVAPCFCFTLFLLLDAVHFFGCLVDDLVVILKRLSLHLFVVIVDLVLDEIGKVSELFLFLLRLLFLLCLEGCLTALPNGRLWGRYKFMTFCTHDLAVDGGLL